MKRFLAVLALLLAVVALATSAFESKARPVDNIQFAGYVKYRIGTPAPPNTEVRIFLGSELKRTIYLQHSDGRYQIRGSDEEFPTGSYTLKGDDLVGMLGVETNVSHTIHVSTDQDIILDTAY
ncbi:hypothetical protein L6R21_08190 [bacterium]|nr:hypothetical protein [bacterium]